MPDLTPAGRTVTARTRRHARVAWASACAFLSDWAVMAVPTRTDRYIGRTEDITAARRVKLIGQHLQFLAVAKARIEGASWAEIADASGLPDAGTAEAIYGIPCERFVRGDPDPWTTPGVRSAIPESAYGDPDAEAARLDEWYIDRSHGDGSLVPGLRPVTDGLY